MRVALERAFSLCDQALFSPSAMLSTRCFSISACFTLWRSARCCAGRFPLPAPWSAVLSQSAGLLPVSNHLLLLNVGLDFHKPVCLRLFAFDQLGIIAFFTSGRAALPPAWPGKVFLQHAFLVSLRAGIAAGATVLPLS